MIINSDYAVRSVTPYHKCATYKCTSKPADMLFYITEWEMTTGASVQWGIIYCEKCVLEHMARIKPRK